jgi:DNA-directed RNA polymerase subunit RPC12/RpoP
VPLSEDPIKKRFLRILAGWYFGGGVLAVLLVVGDASLLLAFGVLAPFALLTSWALSKLRCPQCGKSVFDRRLRLAGLAVPVRVLWPESVCSRCGHDLRSLQPPARPAV